MKLHFLLFLSLITSCTAQTTSVREKTAPVSFPGDTVKTYGNNIMVIYQDTKNNYWFGSWKDGVYKYDGKILIHYSTKDVLPDNRVDEIKEDQSGNIYINTPKGIVQFNGKTFKTLIETGGGELRLNPGDVWFKNSTYYNAIYRYDGEKLYKFSIPKTPLGEEYLFTHPNVVDPYGIYCIYSDRAGNLWLGTSAFGACRYNGKSFDWISEPDVTELHDGPSNGVRSITEDKNGDFWFNSAFKYSVSDSSSFSYKRIESIGSLTGKNEDNLTEYLSSTRDHKNNLWFATYTDGVWKYDGKKITHYPIQLNDKDVKTFYIYTDRKGTIWLGTHENGIFRFNGKKFEQVRFN